VTVLARLVQDLGSHSLIAQTTGFVAPVPPRRPLRRRHVPLGRAPGAL